MWDFNKIQEQVQLVKEDIQNKFPNCNYTINILLWDDGWTWVECRYGKEKYVYISSIYEDKLSHEKIEMLSDSCIMDAIGNEYYVEQGIIKIK
jgi:hypothetical protein